MKNWITPANALLWASLVFLLCGAYALGVHASDLCNIDDPAAAHLGVDLGGLGLAGLAFHAWLKR